MKSMSRSWLASAIAVQAALSVDSKLAISVVWLVYDPVFDTYREQAQ